MPIRSLSKQNNDGIFAPIQLLASTTTMNDPPPDHDVVCSRTPEKGLYEIENVVDVYCIYPLWTFQLNTPGHKYIAAQYDKNVLKNFVFNFVLC